MFNPFKPVELIKAEVFMTMPAKFRKKRRSAWSDANRQGAEIACFLEGPSFDRDGNLWFVDVPFGRVFRITPGGDWELATEYDGWPNGLKIHRDGRIFICDYKKGLLVLDPKTGAVETLLDSVYSEGFKGVNDLHFASNGDLYFTDQGQTGIADPSGRVFRLRASGALDRLASTVPSPNGITLSTNEKHCYVAATRSQQIWRLPLMADGSIFEGRGGDPALRRSRRTGRHRDGCGERLAGVPARYRRLALRRQHVADASRVFGSSRAPPPRKHRFWWKRQPGAVHHRIAVGRYSDGETAGCRQAHVRVELMTMRTLWLANILLN